MKDSSWVGLVVFNQIDLGFSFISNICKHCGLDNVIALGLSFLVGKMRILFPTSQGCYEDRLYTLCEGVRGAGGQGGVRSARALQGKSILHL